MDRPYDIPMLSLLTKTNAIVLGIAVVLPGVGGGIAEYFITNGLSGWGPVWGALIGGLSTIAVMWFLESRKPVGTQSPTDQYQPLQTTTPQVSIAGDKVLSRRTPHELVDLVRGRTTIDADYVSKPYLDAWLRVEGSVFDVQEKTRFRGNSLQVNVKSLQGDLLFFLDFDTDMWGPRLRTLKVGDRISTIGKIIRIDEGYLSLEECELVGE